MGRKVTDGGRKPRATDADILDGFRETDDPVLSTAEVADRLPIKRRGTLNRLQNLRDAGELEAKQIGGRNTIWWLADSTDS
jgi:GTP-sensing pleiotropic transcriptional regulator CodY